MTIQIGSIIRVKHYEGVAFRVDARPKRWEPYTVLVEDEEGNVVGEEDTGEGEWVEDDECGRWACHMVGDDRTFVFDEDELKPLDDLDYCAECGQIGCTADGRDRTEASE